MGFSLENVRRSFADVGIKITDEMLSKMLIQPNATIFHIAVRDEVFEDVCKSLADTGIKITDAMMMIVNADGEQYFIWR